MKFTCTCGQLIVDPTDSQNNKGHLISDIQWNDFWDAIDEAIENCGPSPKEKEAACMQLRSQPFFHTIWECTHCGQLWVEGKEGRLISYSPDSGEYNKALNRL